MDTKEIAKDIKSLDDLNFKSKPIKGRISDENYKKIGRIIGLFQRLEYNIKKNISTRLEGNEKLFDCVIEELSYRGLVQSLQSLLIAKNVVLSDVETELIKQARKIEQIRNRFVHSMWVGGEKSEKATRFKKTSNKKGLSMSFQRIAPSDFDLIIEWIDKLDTGFDNLNLEEVFR